MTKLAKLAVVSCLYYSGLLWLYASMVLRGRAVVLTYHRVLPRDRQRDSFSQSSIVVTPGTFDRHMRFLRRFMRPVSVEQFAALRRSGKPLPPRTCLVTFDDGWYDNLEYALPILRKHSVPAVLFVATDYLGSDRCFWQEHLSRLIHRVWQQRERSAGVFGKLGLNGFADLSERDIRPAIAKFVSDTKSKKRPAEIAALVTQLRNALSQPGVDPRALLGEDRFLSWAQVDELQRSGVVSIGSHAMTHTPLDKQALAETQRELVESRRLIRERLGTDPTTFAYPNGDFDDDTVDAVRAAGYELAFTTRRGTVSASSDALRLERINIHEAAASSPAALLGRIAGLA